MSACVCERERFTSVGECLHRGLFFLKMYLHIFVDLDFMTTDLNLTDVSLAFSQAKWSGDRCSAGK